ncbi:hypothetical protein HY090_02335 [Candidatus Kaiserbacteria bacterium]|nr:hypothetical protein [Candidatus Kaiserbacteria bacterium]
MDIFTHARQLMIKNRRFAGLHQYTMPSSGQYPYQWLWDSCFHTIILSTFDPEAAKAELRSLFLKQEPNGTIPHLIFWNPVFRRPHFFAWGKKGTSSITQPPMLAYAVFQIYLKTKDLAFLEEMYPKLLSFYQYLVNERDPQDHHLAGIIIPDESGEDNSPRFDAPLHLSPTAGYYRQTWRRFVLIIQNRNCNFDAALCMSKNFWVKDVPFNAILVRNLASLAQIASLLRHKDGEQFATLNAKLTGEAMRERLFADGVFWSAMDHDYKPIRVATWAHFAPLFAGLYTKEEAQALVRKHFHNTETFHAPYGIRTVSKQEPSYNPRGFWRGPVWMATNWIIYKGLVAYGFIEEAKEVRNTSIALLEKNGFREYFNPETGKGLGARDFTWGALILDMME